MSLNSSFYLSQFPHGLMFHRFHKQESFPVGQGSITPGEFEKILHFVGIDNILSPEEWLFKLKNNSLKGNDLCITFDDGLRCQYDICLPILEKYNLKVFWFIYSSVFEGKINKFEIYSYFGTRYFSNIDEFFELFFSRCEKSTLNQINEHKFKKYLQEASKCFSFYSPNDLKFRFIRDELLSKEKFENIMDKIMEEKGVFIAEIVENLWLSNLELRALSENGHCIGLHSYSHPFQLSKLSYEEQLNQYLKNYNHINKICNKEIISMSHPLNSYNESTLRVLSDLGILCGFRSNMAPPNGKKINPSCLEMAREDAVNILKTIANTKL